MPEVIHILCSNACGNWSTFVTPVGRCRPCEREGGTVEVQWKSTVKTAIGSKNEEGDQKLNERQKAGNWPQNQGRIFKKREGRTKSEEEFADG
jgi:hypothetical protein